MRPQPITKEDKKVLLNMWSEMYPSLSVYKRSPVWLLNICGPLVVGLLLEIKSNRESYYPTWHICNLCDNYINNEIVAEPYLGLLINLHYYGLTMLSKESDINKVVENYNNKKYIPLSGDVLLSQLLTNLEAFYEKQPNFYKGEVLKELIYLSVWSGVESVYTKYKEFVDREFEALKHNMSTYAIERFNSLPIFNDNQKLREQVEVSIKKLKLEKIPRRELIIDV